MRTHTWSDLCSCPSHLLALWLGVLFLSVFLSMAYPFVLVSSILYFENGLGDLFFIGLLFPFVPSCMAAAWRMDGGERKGSRGVQLEL
ncbi:hypothetical protein F4823DRAFT_574081 [Ustulina deusta]|nr:hypothetical protein F4823DRAFT_574081 [Ustulina deusta]